MENEEKEGKYIEELSKSEKIAYSRGWDKGVSIILESIKNRTKGISRSIKYLTYNHPEAEEVYYLELDNTRKTDAKQTIKNM